MDLKIAGITKEFESYDGSATVKAVNNVDLIVRDGDLVTLLGPSGCGKTTLLRMIAGFEDPTRGDIFFGDSRVNDLAPNKRNATLVFQSYAIFPHLNVYENIAFGLRLKNMSSKEINLKMEHVVDLVGLSGLEKRQPSQLSGGQQQRVALARAIVMEPQLLLFDEPLSNLDAKLREQMRIEIRRLQKTLGITSVYVTHDQAEAMSISDVVVVMNGGCIEQAGAPLDLYARPLNRFVADFIGKANFIPANVVNDKILIGKREFRISCDGVQMEGDVDVVVRPETIYLSEDNEQFRGTVMRTTFLGTIIEYEVDVPEVGVLTVHQINPVAGKIFPQGAPVGLSLREETLHVLLKI